MAAHLAGFVQRLGLRATRIVPTRQCDDGLFAAQQLDQATGFDLALVVARQQHAHRCALAFDHRVGGQGRGATSDTSTTCGASRAGGKLVQRGAGSMPNGQVEAGGQAFGRGDGIGTGLVKAAPRSVKVPPASMPR